MRITNNMIVQAQFDAMQSNIAALSRASAVATNGKRLQQASDDPTSATQIMASNSALRALDTYRTNVQRASSRVGLEDDVLAQIGDLVTRAKELGLQQGGTTASAATRQTANAELQQIFNQIVTLGNITTGGDFSFRDTRTLTVNSPLAINGGNGNLSLTTTGSTSDLILATDLTGRTVALAAGRDINQAGSAIHAATLTGSAGRDAHFTGANRIGALGDFTASSLEFDNAQALNVTGSVSTGSGALSLATTSGKLTLAGHVSGGATTLDAAGDMALNGALSASSLALQSARSVP